MTQVRLTRAADVDSRLEPPDRIVWSVSLENPVASGYCPSLEFDADPCPGAPAAAVFLDAVTGARLGVAYPPGPSDIQRSTGAISIVTAAANSGGGGDALLDGAALGGDEARGCVWLESTDGSKTALVWPFGFRAFGNPLRIVGPDGQIVARGGDLLAVGGSAAPTGFAIPPDLDPPEIHRLARRRAADRGLSLAEYVRRLVARDLERPLAVADRSLVFDLADSGGSDVARLKDEYVGEAVDAEWQHDRGRA